MQFRVISVLFCLACYYSAISQISHKPVIFKGKIEGEVSSVHEVRVYYHTRYLALTHVENLLDISKKIDKNGEFEFSLPSDSIGKLWQFVLIFDSLNPLNNDILDNFIVEPGDSVYLTVTVKNTYITHTKCTGPQSSKYQCRSDIIFNHRDLKKQARSRDPLPTQEGNWIAAIKDYLSLLETSTAILNYHKKEISPEVYEIMKADLIGEFGTGLESIRQELYSLILRKGIYDTTLQYLLSSKRSFTDNFSGKTVDLSSQYLEYIYTYEITNLCLTKMIGSDTARLSFVDLFDKFRTSYGGALKELLLTELFINPSQNYGLLKMGIKRRQYINEVLPMIKSDRLKEMIKNNAISKIVEGDDAYNFSLPDTAGKIVKLSDLRGCVVLLDMWSTGCIGCVMFSDRIKNEIKPSINEDQKFRIVSINTDESKEKWMNSIYSGKYTEINDINLQAQTSKRLSSFSEIPLVKYYGFNYLPFVLLIDREGKIVRQFKYIDDLQDIINVIKLTLNNGKRL